MRKLLACAAGLVAMLSVGTTQAEAAKLDGHIKGEPDATLTILVKNFKGDRYVTRVNFKDIPVRCESGRSTTSGSGPAGRDGEFGLPVKEREFSGRWHYGRIDGKFKGSGKVTGELSLTIEVDAAHGECKSGKLEYVVREG
ncbi:MAG: hypothetical protein M3Y34_00130 [Actinomycetota bacterium]|nr:hypothetical protein [Actinomycetota bacterium]